MGKHYTHLLLSSPSLLMTYLRSRTISDVQRTVILWRSILLSLSSAPSIIYSALPTLLDAVEKADGWVAQMVPEEQEFDEVLMALFGDATDGDGTKSKEAVGILERVICSSSGFTC